MRTNLAYHLEARRTAIPLVVCRLVNNPNGWTTYSTYPVPDLMTIRVLAAVIQKDDRYLICKRPEHKRHGGLWEFPGGKIEDGETDLQAAVREMREELDVGVNSVGPAVFARHDEGSVFRIEFMPVEICGRAREIEHSAHAWAHAEELVSYDLAPSDRAFVEAHLAPAAERTGPSPAMRSRELYEVAGQLGELWSLPDLSPTATIEFSDRMTTSLGRCVPSRRLIRLNARLRDGDDELLREVLCHELAHLAVYVRFGRRAKPHGEEWRHLVSLAGYEPRRRAERVLSDPAERDQVGRPERPTRRRTSAHFEHRCPVCQSVRIARTASPRWRCSECVADGLDGELVITRLLHGDR